MAIVNGYCELGDLQKWIGAEQIGSIPNLERAITASSRSIDNFCDRTFWQTAADTPRTFVAPNCGPLVFGANNDLATFVSVKTDEGGTGSFTTTWSASDYELHPLNPTAGAEVQPWTSLRSTGARQWPYPTGTGRSARVQISGTWGWAAVPEAVKQACLIWAARIYKRKESPEGVAGWGDFGQIRIGRTDPDVIGLLEPYQLYPIGFA